MKNKIILLVLMACLPLSANMLINGDFEADGLAATYAEGINNVPTGWQSTGDQDNNGSQDNGRPYLYRLDETNMSSVFDPGSIAHTWPMPDDSIVIGMSGNMSPVGGNGLYQTIETVPGQIYDYSARMVRFLGNTSCQLVIFDGIPVVGGVDGAGGDIVGTRLVDTGLNIATDWTEYQGTFEAVSNQATIMVYGRYDWTFVDSVSVTVVPEPATMALLGFGSVFAVKRRKA